QGAQRRRWASVLTAWLGGTARLLSSVTQQPRNKRDRDTTEQKNRIQTNEGKSDECPGGASVFGKATGCPCKLKQSHICSREGNAEDEGEPIRNFSCIDPKRCAEKECRDQSVAGVPIYVQ